MFVLQNGNSNGSSHGMGMSLVIRNSLVSCYIPL
jgi:hypothetical protein